MNPHPALVVALIVLLLILGAALWPVHGAGTVPVTALIGAGCWLYGMGRPS